MEKKARAITNAVVAVLSVANVAWVASVVFAVLEEILGWSDDPKIVTVFAAAGASVVGILMAALALIVPEVRKTALGLHAVLAIASVAVAVICLIAHALVIVFTMQMPAVV